MDLLYISGPYRGKSKNKIINFIQVCINVKKARKIAKQIWKQGDCALCPHSNTAFMDGQVSDEQFIEGDLEIVQRCDGIVMIEGWEGSEGAKRELSIAKQWNKRIYLWEDGLVLLINYPNYFEPDREEHWKCWY